jgi:hypothetical protein
MEGIKNTGRGNVNTDQIDKAVWFFRKKHPRMIRKVQLAEHLKCDQSRALIILNLLSGVSGDKESAVFDSRKFLVYESDSKPKKYGIFIDREYGISAL